MKRARILLSSFLSCLVIFALASPLFAQVPFTLNFGSLGMDTPELPAWFICVRANGTPEEYFHTVCDQFDTLYREGAESGRVMALPLHPFIMGLPFRIKYLDKVLEHICKHERVWLATGAEIARSPDGITRIIIPRHRRKETGGLYS
jgi:hypothetical protein